MKQRVFKALRSDELALKLERENADNFALTKEDESQVTGSDLPEFAEETWSMPSGNAPANIEKEYGYKQSTSPEEIYEAERLTQRQYEKPSDRLLAKMEMDELAQMREQQEARQELPQGGAGFPGTPPNQTPHARLPPQSIPAGQHPSVTPPPTGMPPQQPQQQPLNPFAQPAPAKPESGLPWKPKAVKHDCMTVHPAEKHEEWERESKFFRGKADGT